MGNCVRILVAAVSLLGVVGCCDCGCYDWGCWRRDNSPRLNEGPPPPVPTAPATPPAGPRTPTGAYGGS